MDSDALVKKDRLAENQINDGLRLLGRLEDSGFAVNAACWVRLKEDDQWKFYVASPVVAHDGKLSSYETVCRIFRSIEGEFVTWFCISDIKVVGLAHPVAKGLMQTQSRFPSQMLPSSQLAYFSGIPLDEVYVYPVVVTKQITIYGQIFQGATNGNLNLSFEPHSEKSSLKVESDLGTFEYVAETGFDWVVAAPEQAHRERDSIGRLVFHWQINGNDRISTAQEVWSFAKLGLYDFRFLSEPSNKELSIHSS